MLVLVVGIERNNLGEGLINFFSTTADVASKYTVASNTDARAERQRFGHICAHFAKDAL